jgi:superfamily II DNA or RNA helicase
MPNLRVVGDYEKFLAAKKITHIPSGIDIPKDKIHPALFDFQRDIVSWALRKGKAATFADCGLGKTFMQLEWARHIPGRVLILAPLAVAPQTVREGRKIDLDVTYSRKASDARIVITNYEMLENFNPADFEGIVLDESSILKSFEGKFRNHIIEQFGKTPFRLACTATPAPNDFMELGNHSEFLGTLTRTEMLSTFFVHDGGDTAKWRLKGHAEKEFWKWVCSWAVMLRKPSDLGYDDKDFILPAMELHERVVDSNFVPDGMLFALEAQTLQDRQKARSNSVQERAYEVAEIVKSKSKEPWLIWCNLNSEADAVKALLPNATEVRGSDDHESKEQNMMGFSDGKVKMLVTKPSIAGFGMNWQHCSNVVFLG